MRNNKKSKKSLFVLIPVIIALVGALVFFNKFNFDNPGNYQSKQKIVCVIDPFSGWYSGLYANGGLTTKTNTINAKNGITVEYVVCEDPDKALNMFLSGEAQAIGITVNRLAVIQKDLENNGKEVVMPLLTNFSNGGDGIVVSNDIHYVEDLIGKEIAVPKNSEGQLLVQWLLRHSNLEDSEIANIEKNFIHCKDADEAAKLFENGRVSAAATWEPNLSDLVKRKKAAILFDTSMSSHIIMGGILFDKEFVDANQDIVVKFCDGFFKAKDYYMSNPGIMRQMSLFSDMSDKEIIDSGKFTKVMSWADNMDIMSTTAREIYREMAEIVGGGKADQAEAFFVDTYVKMCEGYPSDDLTQIAFSEEGARAAEDLSKNRALLKMKLDIKFDAGDDTVSESSVEELREFAKIAKKLNNTYIRIEGHTVPMSGSDGKAESLRRANNVKKYLVIMGVDPKRIKCYGMGDTVPIASNDTEEGRALNRRTEVSFVTAKW